MLIEETILQGTGVRLEPLSATHLAGLAEAIRDGELWKLPITFVPHPDDLPGFLHDAQRQFTAGSELAFATIDQASGKIVGSTRYRCIEAKHRRVEIGFTFIAASWQRSHINTEAKWLMLQHAFEVWQCNRVELLTDFRNQKSRAAIARLGATQEGILRSHMVMRDGYVRDSVLFSITSGEWVNIKASLLAKLHLHSH